MVVVLAILSAGLLGLIIYFAFSQKSSRLLRFAALIALGLIGLSLGVCVIILILGPGEGGGTEIPFPAFSEAPPTPTRNANIGQILIYFVVLAGVMGLIIVLAIRDRRRKEIAPKKAENTMIFQNTDELDDLKLQAKKTETKENFDDDSFDIGLD